MLHGTMFDMACSRYNYLGISLSGRLAGEITLRYVSVTSHPASPCLFVYNSTCMQLAFRTAYDACCKECRILCVYCNASTPICSVRLLPSSLISQGEKEKKKRTDEEVQRRKNKDRKNSNWTLTSCQPHRVTSGQGEGEGGKEEEKVDGRKAEKKIEEVGP